MIVKKSLGQHFLRCDWVIDALIKSAEITKADTVLEVGPGTGVLTRPLAAIAGEVIAVEKDEALAVELSASLIKEKISNVRVITGDILKLLKPQLPRLMPQTKFRSDFDLNLVWGREEDTGMSTDKVIGNIPYYLTSRLLRLLLEQGQKPALIALTIQKEVAERIIAKPPHMNLLALGVQAFGTPRIIKAVPAACFSPRPKVDSAIILISDISDEFFVKNAIRQDTFFALARAGFNQKRKMLANSLTSIVGSKEKSLALIRAAELSDTIRPEELSLQEWAGLTKLV